MVELALATGARKGELFAVQWAGVDLDRRTVRFLDTKNGESRTVPLAQTAVATLKAWKAGKLPVGLVFPININLLDKAWQAARAEAAIEDIRFHDLRHSAASYLAMSGALKKGGLLPSDIDYINLHGTGTQNNDIAEGTAIKRLFGPQYPAMSSTKAFTGHTLGACGGIEAVFSILAIEHGTIYPNLRLQTPMKELPFIPVKGTIKNAAVKHVLSNSFGFGGNCSSLIFSKA